MSSSSMTTPRFGSCAGSTSSSRGGPCARPQRSNRLGSSSRAAPAGGACSTATGGRGAGAGFPGGAGGVVLLDVHVGADSGVEFLEELRRDDPDTSVALLTGSVDTPTILEGVSVDAVIAKPFTLEELPQTVRSLAAGRRIESSPS